MNIKAVQLKKYLKRSDSMYRNIVVSSIRARQIIDERYEVISIEEDIEDSDQLDALLENIDHDLPKPITLAADEFMNDELDWRSATEEDLGEEGSL